MSLLDSLILGTFDTSSGAGAEGRVASARPECIVTQTHNLCSDRCSRNPLRGKTPANAVAIAIAGWQDTARIDECKGTDLSAKQNAE